MLFHSFRFNPSFVEIASAVSALFLMYHFTSPPAESISHLNRPPPLDPCLMMSLVLPSDMTVGKTQTDQENFVKVCDHKVASLPQSTLSFTPSKTIDLSAMGSIPHSIDVSLGALLVDSHNLKLSILSVACVFLKKQHLYSSVPVSCSALVVLTNRLLDPPLATSLVVSIAPPSFEGGPVLRYTLRSDAPTNY